MDAMIYSLIRYYTDPSLVQTYRIISMMCAIVCMGELIRVCVKLIQMGKCKICGREPITFTCLSVSAIILFVLGTTSALFVNYLDTYHQINLFGIIRPISIMLFIFLIHMAEIMIWKNNICTRYNIPNIL